MNDPQRTPRSTAEAISSTAAAWLAQKDEGLTPEEAAEFARWRLADPRHEAAAARLENTWRAMRQLRDFRPEALRHPDRDLLARPRLTPKPSRWPVYAAAACLAAAAILVVAVRWPAKETPAPAVAAKAPEAQYATTAGGYQRMTLEDGSVIELNAMTVVRVQYTPEERRVQLVSGEAHFTVAKNKARPFWVEASGVAVRAVGTAFDVRLDPRTVEVLVTEGHVQVNRPAQLKTDKNEPDIPLLSAGQRAVIPTLAMGTPQIENLASPAIHEALAWQGPRLVFVEMPLAQVVAEFNQRNQVQISLGDDALRDVPIDGSFRPENIEAFVRLITSDSHITVERPDAEHIVLRSVQ